MLRRGSAKAQTNGKNSAGTVPDSGCYIKYTAAANGELAIDTKIGKGKTFYIVAEDGTKAAEVKIPQMQVHIILLKQR